MRIAGFREIGNGWSAWIGKTKNFGDFIEAFTDGIVTSGGNNFKMIVMFHTDNLGVSAGNNESK